MRDDLSLLIDAAREAGSIARRYWQRSPEVWDKPGGLGPVTEADLAVDNMLRETLMAARPDYGWLSEETEDNLDRLSADHVFIVDPIDGTRAFIEGSPTWAHSLAVAEKGKIIAAAIYLPVSDKMYTARLNGGAFLNETAMSPSDRVDLKDARVLATRPNFAPEHWKDGAPPVKRQFRSSLAYRMCLVGEGRFDAMLTLHKTWEWDVAAGVLIVCEAGGKATDKSGEPLIFNNPAAQVDGLIAGGPKLHAALFDRLA